MVTLPSRASEALRDHREPTLPPAKGEAGHTCCLLINRAHAPLAGARTEARTARGARTLAFSLPADGRLPSASVFRSPPTATSEKLYTEDTLVYWR